MQQRMTGIKGSSSFLLPQDVTAKENATATAANKTLVFILSICFKR